MQSKYTKYKGFNMTFRADIPSFYTKLMLYCKYEEAQARKVLIMQGNIIISQILHI